MTDTLPDRRQRPADEQPSYETGGLRLALLVGSLVALGVLAGWAWVAIILGVVVMIFLHELGHFVTAKWSGMKVTEFFIGFGPRIWSFTRGETTYGFKVIPGGAYVRIVGMNNLDEADPADEPRTYRQQSFPKRLLVVSAGSIMHLLQAFVLLVVLLGVVGVPGGTLTGDVTPVAWDVSEITPNSAAEDAGLRDGDRIVAIDGEQASSFDNLSEALAGYEVGDEVDFTIERDGETETVPAVLQPRPEGQAGGEVGSPFLGVKSSAYYPTERIGVGSAIASAPGEMVTFMREAVGAMAELFSPSGLGDFADNVSTAGEEAPERDTGGGAQASGDDGSDNRLISIYGAVRLGAQLSEQGWAPVLVLFFSINIFIAIVNMVPLPPLDGGHAAVAVYERIRSRGGRRYHADMAKLLPLTYAVVMGMILLGMASLYLDIVNPIPIDG
ncbi:MAG: M50 family metallopeptidase [Acidimicrobiales bacterium]